MWYEWVFIKRGLYVGAATYIQYMTHKRPKVLSVDIPAKVIEPSTLLAYSFVEATEAFIFRGSFIQLYLVICLH